MKRALRILLLHFEEVIENKSLSFVWFLIALLNAGFYLLFWQGAFASGSQKGAIGWNVDIARSYYILLVILGPLLFAHIEENVANDDIRMGGLSKYLVKPYSYLLLKFYLETPWRIIQGLYGLFIGLGIGLLLHVPLTGDHTLPSMFIIVCTILLGYLVSFLFKMIVGILALWMVDYSGFQQLVTVAVFIFGGFVVPLEFLPGHIAGISMMLPFASITYFPIKLLQGNIAFEKVVYMLLLQSMWVVVLFLLYRWLWKKGIRKFTAVGQ